MKMKKSATGDVLLLNVLLALNFTACNDDKDNNPDPDNTAQTACQLIKISESGNDDYTAIEYNAQGYVSQLFYKEIGSNASDEYEAYMYNANNQLVKIVTYDNGDEEYYTTFDYTGELLTTAKFFDISGSAEGTITYQYDASKRLIARIYDQDTFKYTYDSRGNVVKEEYSSPSDVSSVTTYENYDDKLPLYLSTKGVPAVYLGLPSKNNPGKKTNSYDFNNDGIIQPSESDVTMYTYKYNEQGYPTEIMETEKSGTEVSVYEYACQ